MDLGRFKPGDTLLLHDGSRAVVLAPSEDGRSIRARYVESSQEPSLVGTEESIAERMVAAFTLAPPGSEWGERVLKQKFAFTTSKVNGKTILTNAHCFDALIATLTARAYVDGDTSDPPSDIPCDVLRAEGWIRIPIRGR